MVDVTGTHLIIISHRTLECSECIAARVPVFESCGAGEICRQIFQQQCSI
jgi:hypothetical protein